MEHVSIGEVPELETNPATSTRRALGDALKTASVAVNHYTLDPGDSLSGGLHAHHDQEELFIVLAGELTFDVTPERETVMVTAGEAVRFAPGEYQEGYNASNEPATVLAIGAPQNTEAIDSYIACRRCEAETIHQFEVEGDVAIHTCQECGNAIRYELTE